MTRLALVMIVKNEERSLARCLESVRGHVDRMIILDTGSDGYGIGFASAEHIDRIMELAQIADCAKSLNLLHHPTVSERLRPTKGLAGQPRRKLRPR